MYCTIISTIQQVCNRWTTLKVTQGHQSSYWTQIKLSKNGSGISFPMAMGRNCLIPFSSLCQCHCYGSYEPDHIHYGVFCHAKATFAMVYLPTKFEDFSFTNPKNPKTWQGPQLTNGSRDSDHSHLRVVCHANANTEDQTTHGHSTYHASIAWWEQVIFYWMECISTQ